MNWYEMTATLEDPTLRHMLDAYDFQIDEMQRRRHYIATILNLNEGDNE